MRPVSDEFTAAVAGSHRMVASARVVEPGQVGTDPAGVDIPVLGGDVAYDATADVRATLDLTTDGTGWDPRAGRHIIQPYGAEIFVRRGIAVATGHTEWVSQGYYRIVSAGQDKAPNGNLRISGQDRMSAIIESRLFAPRQYPASTLASAVIADLVTEVLPDAVIDLGVPDRPIGRDLVTEDDRHAALVDVATALAAVAYFDYRGILVVGPVPDPTMPVWTVAHGDGGVLVSAARSLSREGVYNAVKASGEGADDTPPVSAIAYDDNPRSPTYWSGPYGQVPEFYSSPMLTTVAQCRDAARAELARVIGLPYNMDLTAVPHPGLDPLDVVRVTYPEFAETHILDKLTMPLTAAEAMSATTRQSTTVVIGAV